MAAPIIESPEDVEVGRFVIPAPRRQDAPMLISYTCTGDPVISALEIDQNREMLRGKVVFIGVTALAAEDRAADTARERLPASNVHAQIYETISRGRFLTPVRNDVELLVCALFAAAAGLIFELRSGWQAYALGVLLLALAAWTPVEFFRHDIVFPFFAPVAVAWLSIAAGAAIYQHFFVRRQLRRSESERSRYQQAHPLGRA